jgi:tRNA pseudouridine38-40 synthase
MGADMQRWRFGVAYRGTAFHGFAAQPDQRTVAGEIAAALKTVARLDELPILTCAGRTDAGVHATGQVIHVDLPDPLPDGRDGPPTPELVMRSLNKLLPDEVSITSAELVDETFDARFSARWRRYRYLVHESPTPDPLLTETAWRVSGTLDVRSMHQAIGSILGSHDFRAFCRKAPGTTSQDPIIRLVTEASVREVPPSGAVDLAAGRLIRFELQASSFCHQMVRSVVGQVVDLGLGRSNAADLVALLRQGDREGAAQPAPSHGLCLIGVGYDEVAGHGAGLPGHAAEA